MKLALLTFNIGRDMDLPTLLAVARRTGFAAVELRCQQNHGHGVELTLDAAGRRAVRDAFDDACLDIAGLTISNRFEYPDPARRRESIDETKRYLDLAADLDAHRVRVFGNDLPAGVPRGEVIAYVGDCLAELGDHAVARELEVNLEMHGQFNWWRYAVRSVEHAARPNVGLVYNCDPRDTVGGSVAATLSQVIHLTNHVHLHELTDPAYPYAEFARLMLEYGYDGYCSAEIEASPDAERVLGYYAALWRALCA